MKPTRFRQLSLLSALAAALLAPPIQPATAQTVTDQIEALRGVLKADRKVVVAETLQLNDAESAAFWPLYRSYRTEMDELGDGIVKLVLEYADLYPDVPEDRAEKLLKDYLRLEKDWAGTRAKHLKKIAKLLPASKVLRFAQLENRLDLALRLQLADAIPLAPATLSEP
jgi:hypothetical protein